MAVQPLTSLNRALDVLEAFTVTDPVLALGELSERVGMAKPTARRILVNLIDRGWVIQDDRTRTYRLGIRCWEVGAAAVSSLDLRAAATAHVEELARSTGEQATLWVYDDGYAICIDRAEGPFRGGIRSYTHLGTRELTLRLASGRCLLALQPAEEIQRVLAQLPEDHVGSHRRADLPAHLAVVAGRGYDTSVGDRWPDVSAVAATIRDHMGGAIGAIGVSAPTSRFDADVAEACRRLVVDAAAQIASRLGRSDPALAGSR